MQVDSNRRFLRGNHLLVARSIPLSLDRPLTPEIAIILKRRAHDPSRVDDTRADQVATLRDSPIVD